MFKWRFIRIMVCFKTMITMRLIIPEGYKPLISLKETEKAIEMMKDHFETGLSSDLAPQKGHSTSFCAERNRTQ